MSIRANQGETAPHSARVSFRAWRRPSGKFARASVVLAVSVLSTLLASPAMAEGGGTIAAAPKVVFGQQEFGNLNNGGVVNVSFCGNVYEEFWLVPVTIGDRVSLDWEINGWDPNSDGGAEIDLFPVGTTDFTIDNVQALLQSGPNSEGKQQISWTASSSGQMVVRIASSCVSRPYAYDFTAYVTHALAVSVPATHIIHTGQQLTVGVHSPDGGTVSGPKVVLQLRLSGRWISLGSAKTVNSAARVFIRVPAHYASQSGLLRAQVSGVGYKTTSSRVERVRLS